MKIKKSFLSVLLIVCMLTQLFPTNTRLVVAETVQPTEGETQEVLEEVVENEETTPEEEQVPEEEQQTPSENEQSQNGSESGEVATEPTEQGENEAAGGEEVKDYWTVTFIAEGKNVANREIMKDAQGEEATLQVLPEHPFKAGYRFIRWYDQDNRTVEITEDTVIEKDTVAVAEFEEIIIFLAEIGYYYNSPSGEKIEFFNTKVQLEK